ncbi:MAG TPA: radical SAM protein [candidate division Zixibacteria bacterium]|nr:radical SAM protein [candidate division Zixibacteria bacterium]
MDQTECVGCPHECHADRSGIKPGVCGCDNRLRVASVCRHLGEEPVISGETGICNIFFGHCNLQCRFCQNYQISDNHRPLNSFDDSLNRVVNRIEAVLNEGARGVGFVSPSHCIPQMLDIIIELQRRNIYETCVFNSNGYDRPEVVALLEPIIPVWLPDFKYSDDHLSREYSNAPDYLRHAGAAIVQMYNQVGADIELDDEGKITRGLVIRHLVLPGQVENSLGVLRFIAEQLSPDVHISLMSQYHPTENVQCHPDLGRPLYEYEYEAVLDEFERLGFYRGWIQELSSSENYRPDFDRKDPFNE